MNAVELRAVQASYGGAPVLHDVDLTIPAGRLTGIVGPNGAGKSTLLKAVLQLVPTRGRIRLLGRPLPEVRRRVAYVAQRDAIAEDFPITAVQVVEMGRYPHRGWLRRLRPADDQAVAEAMERTGVTALADLPFGDLSGGQRQRVLLARALAQQAQLLLLDEPLAAVDARTEATLLDVLTSLAAAGTSVLAVHHDLRTVARTFHHAVLLSAPQPRDAGSSVVAAGPVDHVLTTQHLATAYGIAPLVDAGTAS